MTDKNDDYYQEEFKATKADTKPAENDDYYQQDFKTSSADSKTTQSKTPDDVQKTQDKLSGMNVHDDQNLYKSKKKQVVTEEVDEDNMYSEEPNQFIMNTDDDIEHNFQMIQRKKEGYVPEDTLFVFMGEEFLYLDYKKDTWAMGDVEYVKGQATFTLPQDAAIVKIDKKMYDCNHSNAIVLGGIDKSGYLLNWAFGIEFFNDKDIAGQ